MADVPAYSGAIEVSTLDPVYHSSEYTTFELNDSAKTYLTNMKLVNVGFTSADVAPLPHKTIGLMAGIRHVRLELGGTEVCSQRFLNRLALFKTGLSAGNSEQACLQNQRLHSDTGYEYGHRAGTATDASIRVLNGAAPAQSAMTAAPATTPTAVIDLRDILGFLASTDYLHTAAVGKIVLRIEWETANFTVQTTGNGTVQTAANQLVWPQLVVNHSRSAKMAELAVAQLSRPITFPVWLHDQFYAPAPSVADVQQAVNVDAAYEFPQVVAVTPRAFDGQFVQRILQMNEPTLASKSDQLGRLQSLARFKGMDRVMINGMPEFGAYGIHTPARRATILHDAFEGEHSHAPTMELCGTMNGDDVLLGYNSLYGSQEFTGYMVARTVASMQLEWQRTCVKLTTNPATTPAQQAINQPVIVRLFGEVFHTRLPNGNVSELSTV